VDPRASLDDVKNRKFLTLLGLEVRHLRRPARNQSLYRLRYPGSVLEIVGRFILATDLGFRLVTPDAAQSAYSLARLVTVCFATLPQKFLQSSCSYFQQSKLKKSWRG
jgi:hypothetical protein